MRTTLPLACLTALAFAGSAAGQQKFATPPLDPGETGMFSGGTISSPGMDFVQASTTTRASVQSCPLVLDVPPIPPDAEVFQILAFWNYLTDDLPSLDSIAINGQPILGNLIASGDPDLCWTKAFGCMYSAADASPGLVIGGLNTIEGVCDKALGADPAALGEGITIVVVYTRPWHPEREVSLQYGYSSTQSSGTGTGGGVFTFVNPYVGGDLHMMLNALDGQTSPDEFHLNGLNAGGVVNGTSSPTDAWVGLAGPFASENYYDVAEDDVSIFVSVGGTTLDFLTTETNDCIGHSVGWTAHATGNCYAEVYCEPPSSPNNNAAISINSCDLSAGATVTMMGGPAGQFAYLLVGFDNQIVTNPGGALGDLCVIGGDLRRYTADAGAISGSGSFSTDISNSASGGPGFGLPGGGNIQPGDTFFFQYWHRDGPVNPSRFSSAIGVHFE